MTERSRQEATTTRRERAGASSISPQAEVSCLTGVGPQTAARLRDAGVDHIRALACLAPISISEIFTDGFESGNTSAWSSTN